MIHGQQPQRDEWGTAGNEEENMTRESAVSLCSPSRCPSGRDDTKWRGSQFKGSVVRIVHVKYTLSTEQTITQSCNRKIASYHQWSSGVGDEHRRSSVPLINTGRGLIQLGWMKCNHYFYFYLFFGQLFYFDFLWRLYEYFPVCSCLCVKQSSCWFMYTSISALFTLWLS